MSSPKFVLVEGNRVRTPDGWGYVVDVAGLPVCYFVVLDGRNRSVGYRPNDVEDARTVVPEAKLPVTAIVGSDRYAGVIESVDGNALLMSIPMNHRFAAGRIFTRRRDGHYYQRDTKIKDNFRLILGVAEDYRDPSF